MINLLKTVVRTCTRKLGYAVLDLRKDQSPGIFLPGHLKTTFDALGVNCIIDVGANIGQYASMIRNAGYTGRIISIEPVTGTYAALSKRAEGDSSWQTLNIALGEKDEDKVLNVFAASDLSSFLGPSAKMSQNIVNSCITKTQPATVRRLDSIFEQIVAGLAQPRVFLKLDTQGYDLQVVRGANESLRHVLGLQSELSVIPLYEGMADYIEALAFYRSLDFEPTGIFPVAHDRKTRHVLEFDAVLTRHSTPEA